MGSPALPILCLILAAALVTDGLQSPAGGEVPATPAAPYVDTAMAARPGRDPLDYKDAVFLSPHKSVGGPGSLGVLAVHRDLLRSPVPAVPGGGTVRVRRLVWGHHLLDDVEHREEGGTPDIIGSIRAGLAFAVKEAIGLAVTTSLEGSAIQWPGQPPPADRRRSAAVGPMSGRHCGAGAPRKRVTSAASAARARRTSGSTSSNPVPLSTSPRSWKPPRA